MFAKLGYANKAHDWTVAAKTLRRAAALEGEQIDRVVMTIFGTRLVGAGIGGLVKLRRRFPWTVPVAALLTMMAGQRLWRVRADLRSGAAELLEELRPHMRRILSDLAEYAELRADFVTVHDPPWRTESTTERCARTLD